MAHAKNHDYHILNPSIWPLLGRLGGFVCCLAPCLDAGDDHHCRWMFS